MPHPLTTSSVELDRVGSPDIVARGRIRWLELAQAMRRFGGRVTVLERATQLAGPRDSDVAEEVFGCSRKAVSSAARYGAA